MIDRAIDCVDAFAERWRVPISVASIAWFIATCADYAGFIRLPIELPISGWIGVVPVALWNAGWWGFAYPRIEARRAERKNMETRNG